MFHLFGRHSGFRDHPPSGVSQHSLHPADSGGCRHGHSLLKKHFGTLPGGCTLGFSFGSQGGVLKVPSEKLTTCRRELGKLLTHKEMSCRKMAAILGQVRSFLTAIPFFRAFTDLMLEFVSHHRNLGGTVYKWFPPCSKQKF